MSAYLEFCKSTRVRVITFVSHQGLLMTQVLQMLILLTFTKGIRPNSWREQGDGTLKK